MARVLSGVVLAGAAVVAIVFLPVIVLRLLACVVALLAAAEYQKITRAQAAAVAALVVCWFVSSGQLEGFAALPVAMAIGVTFEVLWRGSSIQSAATGAFAGLYLGVPLGMLAAIHGRFGWTVTLYLIGTVVVSDTAQYYSGRAFGRHLLAPAISPKKTIEGAAGGVIVGTAFVAAVGARAFNLPLSTTLPFGAAAVVLGILGDLFESRLKRAADLKDSSHLIPGHGGVLDRIDALLFVTPLFYVLFHV